MSCTLSVSLHTVGVAHTVTFSVVQCRVHSWCCAHCHFQCCAVSCTLLVLCTLSLSVLCSVVYTLGVVHTVTFSVVHTLGVVHTVTFSVVHTLGVVHTVGVMRAHCVHSDKFVAMLTLHFSSNIDTPKIGWSQVYKPPEVQRVARPHSPRYSKLAGGGQLTPTP